MEFNKTINNLVKLDRFDGNGTLLNKENYKKYFESQLKQENFEGKENLNLFFLDKELAYNAIGHTGGDPGTNVLMYFDSEKKIGRIFMGA